VNTIWSVDKRIKNYLLDKTQLEETVHFRPIFFGNHTGFNLNCVNSIEMLSVPFVF